MISVTIMLDVVSDVTVWNLCNENRMEFMANA